MPGQKRSLSPKTGSGDGAASPSGKRPRGDAGTADDGSSAISAASTAADVAQLAPGASQRELALHIALVAEAAKGSGHGEVGGGLASLDVLGGFLSWVQSKTPGSLHPFLLEVAFAFYGCLGTDLLKAGRSKAALLFVKRFASFFVHAHAVEVRELRVAAASAVSGDSVTTSHPSLALWAGGSQQYTVRMPRLAVRLVEQFVEQPGQGPLRECLQSRVALAELAPDTAKALTPAGHASSKTVAPALPLTFHLAGGEMGTFSDVDNLVAGRPVWWASFHEAGLLHWCLAQSGLEGAFLAAMQRALAKLPLTASCIPTAMLLFGLRPGAAGAALLQHRSGGLKPFMALVAGSVLHSLVVPGSQVMVGKALSKDLQQGKAAADGSITFDQPGHIATTMQAQVTGMKAAAAAAAAAEGGDGKTATERLHRSIGTSIIRCMTDAVQAVHRCVQERPDDPPNGAAEPPPPPPPEDVPPAAAGEAWTVSDVTRVGVPVVPPGIAAPVTVAWGVGRGAVSGAFADSTEAEGRPEVAAAVTRAQTAAEAQHMWLTASGQGREKDLHLHPLVADATGATGVSVGGGEPGTPPPSPGSEGGDGGALRLPPHAPSVADLPRLALAQVMSRASAAQLPGAVSDDVYARIALGSGAAPDGEDGLPSIVAYTYACGGGAALVSCMCIASGEVGGSQGGHVAVVGRADGSVLLRRYASATDPVMGDEGTTSDHAAKVASARGIGHATTVTASAVCPSGVAAVTGDASGQLLLWNTTSEHMAALTPGDAAVAPGTHVPDPATRPVVVYQGVGGVGGGVGAPPTPWALAWNPAVHCLFASGGRHGLLRVWATHRVTPVRELLGHVGDVTALAWLPNGMYLVSGGDDGTVRVWDVAAGQCARICVPGVSPSTAAATADSPPALQAVSPISALALSPDGQWIAALHRCGTLRLWHVDAAVCVCVVPYAHVSSPPTCVSFSTCGAVLVTAEQAGTLHVWDVESLLSAFGRGAQAGTRHSRLKAMAGGSVVSGDPMAPLHTFRCGAPTPHTLVFTPRNLLVCGGTVTTGQ